MTAVTVPMMMMVMVVVVAVIVMMIMAMVMIVIMVVVAMRRAAMAGIGAAHRIELGDDVLDPRAQPFEHCLDDVIAQDENAGRLDRRREMAVADMPGEFGEVHRIAPEHLVKRLVGGGDDDLAARLDHQPVIRLEHDRLGEVDENLAAIDELHGAAAQVPFVMRQHGAAERLPLVVALEFRCAPDGDCPQHSVSPL